MPKQRASFLLAALLAALALPGCGSASQTPLTGLPPVAEQKLYDSDWGHNKEAAASQRFTDIVQRKFPLGSDEAAMIGALLQQGFKYLPPAQPGCVAQKDFASQPVGVTFVPCPMYDPKHLLKFSWTPYELPVSFWPWCGQSLGVLWDAQDGKITKISGFFGGECV